MAQKSFQVCLLLQCVSGTLEMHRMTGVMHTLTGVLMNTMVQ